MNIRLDIASRLLAEFAANGAEAFYAGNDYREKWAGYALAWADELIKQHKETGGVL